MVLILFWIKFSFKLCSFESYGFGEQKFTRYLNSCRDGSLQPPWVRLKTLTSLFRHSATKKNSGKIALIPQLYRKFSKIKNFQSTKGPTSSILSLAGCADIGRFQLVKYLECHLSDQFLSIWRYNILILSNTGEVIRAPQRWRTNFSNPRKSVLNSANFF